MSNEENEENVSEQELHRHFEEWLKKTREIKTTPLPEGVLRDEVEGIEGIEMLGFTRDDPYFHRPLTPTEEQILVYTEEANRQFAQKDRANRLRRNFATPPPMERIMIEPNPHLTEMQFPQHAVIGVPKPGPTEANPGELRDERGIKQPSHTPPFWAAAPGRTSKKRGKR